MPGGLVGQAKDSKIFDRGVTDSAMFRPSISNTNDDLFR